MSCTSGRDVSKVRALNLNAISDLAPFKGIRIPEFRIFVIVESGIREILSCGIWNPGL